ncbi:MAG: DUF1622 domain-containing protein [Faecousia sp.]
MEIVYGYIEEYFNIIMQYAILLVEIIGVGVLLFAIGKALVGLFKKEPHVRLALAEGIALSLEFKMGGELLRTVVVRQWSELLILGAVILLRAALTFLIHWEIKNEKKSEKEQEKEAISKTT